ncbi:hypothetical protein G5V59_13630 [Nocardioides sp. W3-2-3]|uniref:hypothetical protein n=1 Tax=Nocardioides convexus TaxID=2712224 RepID=UPI0024189108|nr:hypothetical protein [Nocardioides convexus]NHA00697.1 hypothetical protein [Nocardioides convexus]
MILNLSQPCYEGYTKSRRNPETERKDDLPMPNVGCTDKNPDVNPRGLQNLQRPAPGATKYDIAAHYDKATDTITWDIPSGGSSGRGNVAPTTLGEDSWKWLYLQPTLDRR